MIAEKALRLAGDGAVLVARPAGVRHVYVGPLTPSGRFVPRSSRTVCRARTGRLEVVHLLQQRSSSLSATCGRRLCARCSACLGRGRARPGQAGLSPRTPESRAAWAARYAGITRADVAFALEVATSLTEVDACDHVALMVFGAGDGIGAKGRAVSFTERGRTWAPLHQLVGQARGRLGGMPDAQKRRLATDMAGAAAIGARKARAAEIRDARARRIGLTADHRDHT